MYKTPSYSVEKGNQNDMILKINRDIIMFLMKARLPEEQTAQKTKFIKEPLAPKKERLVETREDLNASAESNSEAPKVKSQPFRAEAKTGRNDPCPCGSGKKYKQCHGQIK